MVSQEKKKVPLILGIVSIAVGFLLSPLVGVICGIVGLVLGINNQNNSKVSYKTEIILNIVGLVVSVLTWIYALVYVLGSLG